MGGKTDAPYMRRWRREHPDQAREIRLRYRQKLRREVLQHYGGQNPSCACCGESRDEFLTIDHIHGGGGQERREQGHRGGTYTYRYLRSHGYPDGYRVLCWNCNLAISIYGSCPHQEGPEDKPLRPSRAVVYAVVR